MTNKLLKTHEAAEYLGVSSAFLERDRCYEARIPYVHLAARSIRYSLAELDRYIEQQTKRSTSEV